MGWKLFSAFGASKLEQAGDSLAQKLASFDPEGMTEAGMKMMDDELVTLTEECAKARQEFEKEQAEYIAIDKKYGQLIAAAGVLQDKIAGGAADLEPKLNKLLDEVEKLAPELDREKAEADEAKAYLDEMTTACSEMAEQLKNARSEFESAKRDMARAEREEAKAQRDEERAKRLAGIRNGGSSMGNAMNAMKNAAAEKRAEANATKMRADLLKPAESVTESDPDIAAALAEASGEVSTATLSAADRLAALRR